MSRDYILQPFQPPIEARIDYAAELNDQQRAAVMAPPGPSLVIAGAGSGKTRTLTYRAAFLLEQGIPPERILLLTFTNKAAREMMRRVTDLLGVELPALWGGTFHSIGARILRRNAAALGYGPDFSILDREDARDMLQACLVEMDVSHKDARFPKADVLGDIFSLAAGKDEPLATVVNKQFDYFSPVVDQLAIVKDRFASRKRAANALDFDDLLVLWLKLLRENAEVREQQQRRFQFILVDEYQDTNRIQGELIDLLAARHHNVMAVGDDSQSIYSWRGAHFQNIINFPERYAGAAVYKIETNYRSTPEILKLANAAIAANVNQFSKHLAAARRSGSRPVLVPCATGGVQAIFVAQRILELREEGRSLGKMAVLYRSHFHALELQLELTRRNIPFSITSGIRFFEQAHIKDVTAYVKFITNPHDELALKRIVRLMNGVGPTTAGKIWSAFNAAPGPPLAVALQKISSILPKKTAVDWAQFTATVAQLEDPEIRRSPARIIQLVLEAGYDDYLQETYANYRSRREDIEQLAGFSRQFQSVEDFLTQLALQTSVEAEEDVPGRRDEESVRLSTIHQAKGLEFDVVFIIMLCDGLFPSARSLEHQESEEEERRLFYVAITRARDELHLCYPVVRTMGAGGDAMQQPSRFLAELPGDLIEEWNLLSGFGAGI